MNESLFGTGPQLWPTSPFPGLSYFQPPQVPRLFTGGSMASTPPVTDPGQGGSGSWTGVTPAALPYAPMPVFPEMPTVTPQALLTAVAIRRGQAVAPSSDQEIEDFISDALDLLPGANDVEVRCENGRATLTGTVSHKRLKRDVGEIVWAIPSVSDVHNNVTITARRRARPSSRDSETPVAAGAGRKQA